VAAIPSRETQIKRGVYMLTSFFKFILFLQLIAFGGSLALFLPIIFPTKGTK